MADMERADRLDGSAVEARIGQLDEAIGQLEQMPGRTAELAMTTVEILLEVYGEALARICECLDESALQTLAGDDLVNHLLLLHHLHPDPTAVRVQRAVTQAHSVAKRQHAGIELVELRDATVHVAVSGAAGCSAGALRDVVRAEVLAAAPEVVEVEVVERAVPTLIPVAAITRRAASSPGGPA